MKGLDLARRYYEECGKKMLKNEFPETLPFLAIGLVGSGSECYGFDDEVSRDHDFEPGFCIFLPDENIVDRKTAFRLERAYTKLPNEFMGFKRNLDTPVGGRRHGVIRMDDFFLSKCASADGELSLERWFSLPEYSLLEATNGEVFEDFYGQFSNIRAKLKYFPEDVRLKKFAGHLLLMAQSGQYNYARCISRGETAAAQMAVFEFVKSAIHCIYLLNRAYVPYYKWVFKALKELPLLSNLANDLEYLISSGNAQSDAEQKVKTIENICAAIKEAVETEGITHFDSIEMEPLSYAVNDKICDLNIRNLNILHGV